MHLDDNHVVRTLLSVKKGVKTYYNTLISSNEVIRSQSKWENIFAVKLVWESIYTKPFKTTPDTKLRWFQFRILRLLSTNSFLFKLKLSATANCSFCRIDIETIYHLFWECVHVQKFWNSLSDMLLEKCSHVCNLNLTPELVIFGLAENFYTDDAFDLILLYIKVQNFWLYSYF